MTEEPRTNSVEQLKAKAEEALELAIARVASGVPVVLVARAVLGVSADQLVPAEPVVPPEREALVGSENQVPVELIVPVEAVLEQGHRPVQVALAPRTKSAIAALHPDQAPLLEAGEDLAGVVAETTREPAAAEAATAWAGAA